MIFDDILNKIEEYDSIALFHHEHPDCDAYGSSFGLGNWIKENYPNKKVLYVGTEEINQGKWPHLDEVSDEDIKNSLVIVTDTSDTRRIDDKRFSLGKYLIKIDHHPNLEPYGDLVYVDEDAAASCEIITSFIRYFEDKVVTKDTAEYLYKGLLTDTLQYRTSSTTSKTLDAGQYLANFGIDIPEINRELFDISIKTYEFLTKLRSRVVYNNKGLAYVILDENELKMLEISPNKARDHVDVMGNVKEFEIWALFTEVDGKFKGSLRSKHVTVNTIANKYNGGGHKNASGVSNLSRSEVDSIIDDLAVAASDYIETKN